MSAASSHALESYRAASGALPEQNRLWPLYGAGFDNLGINGQYLNVPLVHPGPGELLVRHDAASICVSDVKTVRAGEQHQYIHHNARSGDAFACRGSRPTFCATRRAPAPSAATHVRWAPTRALAQACTRPASSSPTSPWPGWSTAPPGGQAGAGQRSGTAGDYAVCPFL